MKKSRSNVSGIFLRVFSSILAFFASYTCEKRAHYLRCRIIVRITILVFVTSYGNR